MRAASYVPLDEALETLAPYGIELKNGNSNHAPMDEPPDDRGVRSASRMRLSRSTALCFSNSAIAVSSSVSVLPQVPVC